MLFVQTAPVLDVQGSGDVAVQQTVPGRVLQGQAEMRTESVHRRRHKICRYLFGPTECI